MLRNNNVNFLINFTKKKLQKQMCVLVPGLGGGGGNISSPLPVPGGGIPTGGGWWCPLEIISKGSEVGGGGGGGGKLSLWDEPALDPRVGVPAGLEPTAAPGGGAGGGWEGLEGEPSTLEENNWWWRRLLYMWMCKDIQHISVIRVRSSASSTNTLKLSWLCWVVVGIFIEETHQSMLSMRAISNH